MLLTPRGLLAPACVLFCVPVAAQVPVSPFLVRPYIQIGNAPTIAEKESLVLLWQTEDTDAANWQVEMRIGGKWTAMDAPRYRRVAIPGANVYRLYSDVLTDLNPGASASYRVLKNGAEVFAAAANARKPSGANTRFAVFGDCGENTPGQKAAAYQVYKEKPDYVFLTGNIVYRQGEMAQYYEKYFPIYNADRADPAVGAPLIRSTLFFAAPGNHDTNDFPDLNAFPDALAYFLAWAMPLNGPTSAADARSIPPIAGDDGKQSAFTDAANGAFPRMANYSFDYGSAHWLALDANPYTDWTDKRLRDWVEADLAAAKNTTWRFVAFHQPPFKSAAPGEKIQEGMRVLTDLFEKYKVDVVFSGHVHNYQRTRPLHFVAQAGLDGKLSGVEGAVRGQITQDTAYDGVKHTRPNGVIYIITGGSGSALDDPTLGDRPTVWRDFTVKLYSKGYSYTAVELHGKTLTARQVSDTGAELDRFIITK